MLHVGRRKVKLIVRVCDTVLPVEGVIGIIQAGFECAVTVIQVGCLEVIVYTIVKRGLELSGKWGGEFLCITD